MKSLASVVVPFYNEEANVQPLTKQIEAAFTGLDVYDYECVFVNDGSTDGTRAAIDALAAAHPCIRALHLTRNYGQSAALVAGMRRARGEYVVTLDGDLQNDPADIPRVLELLRDYDCVFGYREKRQDNWLRKLPSRAGNWVFRNVLGASVRDAGCGLKGFRRACVEHVAPFNGVHRFFGPMMLMGGKRWTEIPVRHHPRVHGVSKYGIGNRLLRTLYDLVGVGWLEQRYVNFQVEGEE
jgi:glycosyltransferase involved in cell wall biosynthesis